MQKLKNIWKKYQSIFWILLVVIVGAVAFQSQRGLSQEVDRLEQVIESQDSHLSEMERDYQNYQNVVSENTQLSEDLESQKTEIKTLSDQVSQLESNATVLESEIESYKTEAESLKTENEKLKSEAETKQTSSSGGAAVTGSGSFANSGSNSGSSTMVWISATGSKYHNKNDCGNMNPATATQMTKSSAEAMGYDPCSKCY